MKKFILNIILLLGIAGLGVLAAFFATGNNDKNSLPQETIKTFYTSLTQGKWTEALQSCDSSTMKEYVAEFKRRFEKCHNEDSTTASIADRILKGMDIVFGESSRTNDIYTTCYTLKAGGFDKTNKAVLRRVEGKWIITGITTLTK